MKALSGLLLSSVSLISVSGPVFGQVSSPTIEEDTNGENIIIVQTRRRDEALQDVPAVVDAVTSESVAKLNIRDFKEVERLVPGLELNKEANGVGGSAKLRGVNFDITASGLNPTVEFYMNDAPITAGLVLQQMFDVDQIEVQRGPQGTLRGRASPSGSITVTTRKPDLYGIGGTINTTANDIGTINVNGAIGLPIVEGIAAIRVAGVWDENELDRVRPIGGGHDPFARTKAGRVSALLQPLDWLRFEGLYQRMDRRSRAYDQSASFSEVNPDAPLSPVYIDTRDRQSILEEPRTVRQRYNIYNWRAEANLAGQTLIYQGQRYTQKVDAATNQDNANFFPGGDFFQVTHSRAKSTSHEIRLQNESRVLDIFDYVVGFFDQKSDTPTDLTNPTVVRLPQSFGGGIATIVDTPISRTGGSHEQSFFGNLSVRIGETTEIAGGVRHIDYHSEGALVVSGSTVATDGQDAKEWIYSASVKHNFTPDLMVYASTGSSWRPGINVIGDFNLNRSDLENSFLNLPAETSKSYEIGLKSTLLDGRMRFNITGYHQKFKNYPYRVGNSVYYVDTAFDRASGRTFERVNTFNFVGAVPVEVNGIEGDLSLEVTDRWNLRAVASYSLGKIKNGSVPCNDLNGDGAPDIVTTAPTLDELKAAVGSNNLSACEVTQRAAFLPPFSASIQSEYNLPISSKVGGYVRGLISYNGKSKTDPTSIYDDVDAYALVNLYAGIRDTDGMWEISLFAKNLFKTEKALSRSNPLITNYRQLGFNGEFSNGRPVFTGPTSASFTSTYTGVTMTPPREFGINVRYSFGNR